MINDVQINDLDIRSMPYPLARLYQDMLDETDFRIKFRDLVKLFAAELKYLSMICIADYIRTPNSPEVNSQLSESLRLASLGHWAKFLRSIVNHYHGSRRFFCMSELNNLNNAVEGLVSHFVHLRNLFVHPDILPDERESTVLYADNLPLYRRLHDHLDFVGKYPLIGVDYVDNREVEFSGLVPVKGEHGDWRFLVSMTGESALNITPFMLIDFDRELSDVLIYESLISDQQATFILGNHVRFVEAEDGDPENRVNLLRGMLSTCEGGDSKERDERSEAQKEVAEGLSKGSVPLRAFETVAHLHSEQVFNEYRDAGRYDATTHIVRSAVEKAYEDLLSSDHRNLLVLTADSGVGKSTEVCNLYVGQFKDQITWILSGRRVHSGSLVSQLESQFIGEEELDAMREKGISPISALFKTLRDSPTDKKFILILDGLNETEAPRAILNEIAHLVSNNNFPRFKVVVTCRTYAWRRLLNSGFSLSKRHFVLDEDGDIAVKLAPFTESELGKALDRYSDKFHTSYPTNWKESGSYRDRKLLRNPLILRFVFEAYRSKKAIPARLDLATVMEEFTKERIRDQDRVFLGRHLMTYFFFEETDILDSDVLVERYEARESIPSEAEESYVKLVEHVCGEQVYEVDTVLKCSNQKCEYCRQPIFIEDETRTPDRCPSCQSEVRKEVSDNRSTYSRLLSENIISEVAEVDRTRVRFVFDRYFDFWMGRYFLERAGAVGAGPALQEFIRKVENHPGFLSAFSSYVEYTWKKEGWTTAMELARSGSFVAYQTLRQALHNSAIDDISATIEKLISIDDEGAVELSFARAATHALLTDASLAAQNRDELVRYFELVGPGLPQEIQEEVAENLVFLQKSGVDILLQLMRRIESSLASRLNLRAAISTLAPRRSRQRFKKRFIFYMNLFLFGFGNFSGDPEASKPILQSGARLLGKFQQALRNPLLNPIRRPLIGVLARFVGNIYKLKGPLPCNYWEMAQQISRDPAEIRRVGELFDVAQRNVFDLSYEEFCSLAHQENGLLNWYLASCLPCHFLEIDPSKRERATTYLLKLAESGTEMDRYMVGEAALTILNNPSGGHGPQMERILDRIGEIYKSDPKQIFLRPSESRVFPEIGDAIESVAKTVELLRSQGNKEILPWIDDSNSKFRRFYVNTLYFQLGLRRMQLGQGDKFDDLLALLAQNQTEHLLDFSGDPLAERRLVIGVALRALERAALSGYLRESLNTLSAIIGIYIAGLRDKPNLAVYEKSIVAVLNTLTEYFPDEVQGFLDRYNTKEAGLDFLAGVRTSVVERDELLNKSVIGNSIYQAAFANPILRMKFAEFTSRAAAARDADDFFLIYTRVVVRFLLTYQP